MTSKLSIHINPDSIQIETNRNGQKSIKNTNLRGVQEVLTSGERIETPLLPSQWGVQKYIKVNNRELYVITTPPHIHKVAYDFDHDGVDETKEYTIPVPGLCWMLIIEHEPSRDTRKYIHGMAYALKNQILTMNDNLWKFPFSNVDDTWMCWGSHDHYPKLGGSKSVMTIPDQFLTNPTNNHLDHRKYEPFEAEVNGRTIRLQKTSHLFEHLDKEQTKAQEEGKNAEFPYSCLKPHTTLQASIDHHVRQYLR